MSGSDGREGESAAHEGRLSIGPFSRVSGLTVKTIRLYHEKGLLTPSWVDPSSGYRYYSTADVDRARLIGRLRGLDFSLAEIREVLDEYDAAQGALPFLEAHRERIAARRAHLRKVQRDLDRMIRAERQALALERAAPLEVVERDLPPLLVAGLRWKGAYADSGRALGRLYRRFGRHASGAPLNLYYDLEYRDDDADIESCVPLVARDVPIGEGIRTLPAVRAATVVYRGPYSGISRAYLCLMTDLADRGRRAALPIREVYVKGPGALLKGNPERYVTEIQVPLEE